MQRITKKRLNAFIEKVAAKILQVHYITLWKWIKNGKIKAIQPSGKKGRWLIKQEELERFLNE